MLTNVLKSLLHKLTDRVLLPCAHDEIFGLLQLQHHPHGLKKVSAYTSPAMKSVPLYLNIIFGMAPIALCVKITQEDSLFQTLVDACHGPRYLTRDKSRTW